MDESKRPLQISSGLKSLIKLIVATLVFCMLLLQRGMPREGALSLLTVITMLYCITYIASRAASVDAHRVYLDEAMRRSKLIAGRIEQGFICPFYGQGYEPQAIACANCPAGEKCEAGTNKRTQKETS